MLRTDVCAVDVMTDGIWTISVLMKWGSVFLPIICLLHFHGYWK